jgi:hypothetical protein
LYLKKQEGIRAKLDLEHKSQKIESRTIGRRLVEGLKW